MRTMVRHTSSFNPAPLYTLIDELAKTGVSTLTVDTVRLSGAVNLDDDSITSQLDRIASVGLLHKSAVREDGKFVRFEYTITDSVFRKLLRAEREAHTETMRVQLDGKGYRGSQSKADWKKGLGI
jgi:hypothetical protein